MPPRLSDDAQKNLALDLILTAWDEALGRGVSSEMLASTAMFAALADMVDIHGEAAVAQFCSELPDRIRAGEFSLKPDA
jgi:hypothetical protein